MTRTEGPGRSVTSKALALLAAFTASAGELSLAELSRRSGLPLSTAYRIARELVDWGALERVDGGGYRIGLRLWEVGSLGHRARSVVEVVRPHMFDLCMATLESVHLAVLDGSDVLYVEKISGRHASPVKSHVGGRLPPHATAAGKVLLAYAGQSFVEEVIGAGLDRYTTHTIVTAETLRRCLAEVRRTGIGVSREELTAGSVSVASAVFGPDGRAAAALSLTLASAPGEAKRVAMAVRTAALSASRDYLRLGEQPPPPPLLLPAYDVPVRWANPA